MRCYKFLCIILNRYNLLFKNKKISLIIIMLYGGYTALENYM